MLKVGVPDAFGFVSFYTTDQGTVGISGHGFVF